MSNQWNHFIRLLAEHPTTVILDVGLMLEAPLETKPFAMCIQVTLKHPNEHGLTSPQEQTTITDLEDSLAIALKGKPSAVYAGRMTSQGQTAMLFYGPDAAQMESEANAVLVKFAGYEFDIETSEDPGWTIHAKNLKPSALEEQMLANATIYRKLEAMGDNGFIPRPIEHTILFKRPDDRDAFMRHLKNLDGLEFTFRQEDSDEGTHPHSLIAIHQDQPSPEKVDGISLGLFQSCGKFNGKYDGWGCEARK